MVQKVCVFLILLLPFIFSGISGCSLYSNSQSDEAKTLIVMKRKDPDQLFYDVTAQMQKITPASVGANRSQVHPVQSFDVEVHVAREGNDLHGDGSESQPFRTLKRVRNEIREKRKNENSAVVILTPGGYSVCQLYGQAAIRFDDAIN